MPQLLCVHCDHRFDVEEGAKPRCPKCMRVHGLEEIKPNAPAVSPESKTRLYALLGVLVATVLFAGYWWFLREGSRELAEAVPKRPLSATELRRYLEARAGGATDFVSFLEADDAIKRFARESAGSGAGADACAAIHTALVRRVREGQMSRWSLAQPRDTRVRTAAQTFAVLRPNARAKLYPLELVAVAVAACRSLDVDAMVAEVAAFPGERSPPDPSGHFGYFVVALVGADGRATRYFDPWGERTQVPRDKTQVLDDTQAIGYALSHRAAYRLGREHSFEPAFEDVQRAVKLLPRSPIVRTVRSGVLLASGQLPEGSREIEAAAQLRADPPRRNALASFFVATGEIDRAEREVAAAIRAAPEYALAFATQAAVRLARRDSDGARRDLERALELDPDLPNGDLLWANIHANDGEIDEAIARMRRMLQRDPRDERAYVVLGQLHKQAGNDDEMRAVIAQGLRNSRDPDAMRTRVRQILGESALRDPLADDEGGEPDDEPGPAATPPGDEDEEDADAGAGAADTDEPTDEEEDGDGGAGGDFDLTRGSRLLGGGGGPQLRIGNGSKLRVGEDRLRIQMEP
ncbi:MAG: tetratricopeptide repeat protein [Deltaproteobacteria bacterium]|nr:tetratricopeptide repeat protein [Deltaproteobacteria bacterium]